MKIIPSRAKREGVYTGHQDGKPARQYTRTRVLFSATSGYYAPNRKTRKTFAMDYLNSMRQGAYGGHINPVDDGLNNPHFDDYDHGTKLLERDC